MIFRRAYGSVPAAPSGMSIRQEATHALAIAVIVGVAVWSGMAGTKLGRARGGSLPLHLLARDPRDL